MLDSWRPKGWLVPHGPFGPVGYDDFSDVLDEGWQQAGSLCQLLSEHITLAGLLSTAPAACLPAYKMQRLTSSSSTPL